MGALLSTGGLIAAFFAGAVALFAPCCVVFLLPGYLAAAVKNRKWRLIPLTLVFSAGLALVVVPITAGVTMISSFIAANHTILFALGALLMLVFAALSVSGHMWAMPSFMRSPNLTKANYPGFFAFGIFSGIASSCCAPVLAGILTLSAISRSPIHAVAMGLAYVFGMVFPLLVIALCWDVFDLGRRSFTPKPLRLRVFGRSLHTNIINVFVALGFLIMAILIGIVAFTGEMPSSHQQPLWVVGTWIGSTLAPVAQLLAFIPALVQGLILLALAVVVIVVGTVLLPRLADHKHDIDASLAHMLADEHGSAATSMQHSAQHDEMSEEHHLRTSTGEIRNES